jgi:hypothetical protein
MLSGRGKEGVVFFEAEWVSDMRKEAGKGGQNQFATKLASGTEIDPSLVGSVVVHSGGIYIQRKIIH